MAVANKQRPVKKSSWLKRAVVSWVCVAFLGWMVLMAWALWSWIHVGFESTANAIQALSLKQAVVVSEFSDASFTTWLSQRVTPDLRTHSASTLIKAQDVGGRLAQMAQEQMDAVIQPDPISIAPELQQTFNEFWLKAQQFWILLGATGDLLLIKGAILIAAIPLFLLAISAGLVDGLNQRAIRTASLGRESTYVFHKSIPLARRALFWVLGLWLAIPHALSPTPVFVSLSVLLACLVSVTSSRFKKYL
ncbi:DUF4400 domain-containing protein [Legionella taurinensis]|jgi:integrating conjugative element membrane protein (TIGR03747 family)|uniref:DUF4400 domain-containing protein n=1 Tax=Legionella taurinensis TaxID=70611 RepID=UPI00299E2B00|nr:DUF4400 domain-containing protein [Legionella taurinensis]MDX1838105.1 DUF4400 domain-containing protein [Legionella taurinensis]